MGLYRLIGHTFCPISRYIAVCPHSAAACKRIGGLLRYVHHSAAVSAFVGGRAERSAFLSLRLRRERAMIEALSEGGKNAER